MSISYSVITHPTYKYRLDAPYETRLQVAAAPPRSALIPGGWVELTGTGILRLQRGYMWDGPSGPALDTVGMHRASLIHDALYQLIADRKLPKDPWKKHADREFHIVMRQDNVPGWRALYAYWAVRLFGGGRDKYTP